MPSIKQATSFYLNVISSLEKKHIPLMVGGTYGLRAYTGITRQSKDLDLFVTKKDMTYALQQLEKEGFAVEMLDSVWLAKIYHDNFFVDIIFAERHNLYVVDTDWIAHAKKGIVFGKTVLLMPIEQIIRSKCYVKFREKYDGADINVLLFLYGGKIDWEWLSETIEPHWQLLFEQLINFMFVFPDRINAIPKWLIEDYTKRLGALFSTQPDKICRTRGQLVSYEYGIAMKKWKCKPVVK